MVLQKKGSVWPGLVADLLLTVLLAACSSGAPPLVLPRATLTPISSHVSPAPTPTLGAPGCHPPSPLDTSNTGDPEAPGTTPARDLWSLFLGEDYLERWGELPGSHPSRCTWSAWRASSASFFTEAWELRLDSSWCRMGDSVQIS